MRNPESPNRVNHARRQNEFSPEFWQALLRARFVDFADVDLNFENSRSLHKLERTCDFQIAEDTVVRVKNFAEQIRVNSLPVSSLTIGSEILRSRESATARSVGILLPAYEHLQSKSPDQSC